MLDQHKRGPIFPQATKMVNPNGACDDPMTGHALCNLSYFEFYAHRSGVYIHKYPVASVVDQCALTSTTVPPVVAPRLFGDVTAADVTSLIASLTTNTPMCAAAPYAPGRLHVRVRRLRWLAPRRAATTHVGGDRGAPQRARGDGVRARHGRRVGSAGVAAHDCGRCRRVLRAGEQATDAPVLQVGRALKASKRALSEEVRLPGAAIDGARLWLIGHDRVPAHAAIARDVRYWPRYNAEGVLYGYRRETSTIIYAAVMRVEGAVRLAPTDTGEIYKATLVPWTEVVESFRDTGTRRPAFGLAHEDMIRRVGEHVPRLVAEHHAV
jgi:hypothetical protein